jgi:hypothetical protein
MKQVYKILILIIFSLFLDYCNAQIGPIAGYNISLTPSNELGSGVKSKFKSGFHMGIISEIKLYKGLYIQTGITYSTKGTKRSVYENEYRSVKGGFIDISVNSKYKFNCKIVKPFLLAGPFFSYGITGSYLSDYNVGLSAGFGIEVKNCLLSIRSSNIGFFKIKPKYSSYDKMNLRVFSINVAYLFFTKK